MSVAWIPVDCRPLTYAVPIVAHDVRILRDALVDAAPPRIPHHVEHGREALVHAERTHRLADERRHLGDEIRIERGPPRERGREHRGLPRGEPGEALLVDERGDPEPRLAHETALLPHEPRGARGRVDGARAVDARVVPDPVARDVGESAGLARRELVGHGGDDRAVLVEPVAHDLRGLLLERHLRQQGVRPFGYRHTTHPFTAPVRPPTMRFSNRLKKISAGIIDSDV